MANIRQRRTWLKLTANSFFSSQSACILLDIAPPHPQIQKAKNHHTDQSHNRQFTLQKRPNQTPTDKGLHNCIQPRHLQMRKRPRTGHPLIEVLTVCFKNILLAQQPAHDGQNRVHAIHKQQQNPPNRLSCYHQLKQQIHHHKGHRNTAHIAGKAAGFFPEIKTKDPRNQTKDAMKKCVNQIIVNKRHPMVDHCQGSTRTTAEYAAVMPFIPSIKL
jgi:hypothetical protein